MGAEILYNQSQKIVMTTKFYLHPSNFPQIALGLSNFQQIDSLLGNLRTIPTMAILVISSSDFNTNTDCLIGINLVSYNSNHLHNIILLIKLIKLWIMKRCLHRCHWLVMLITEIDNARFIGSQQISWCRRTLAYASQCVFWDCKTTWQTNGLPLISNYVFTDIIKIRKYISAYVLLIYIFTADYTYMCYHSFLHGVHVKTACLFSKGPMPNTGTWLAG